MLRARVRRSGALRYRLRYRNGRDPETLTATDAGDALRQARQRSFAAQSDVSLWRHGVLVAECPIPAGENAPVMSQALMDRLVTAGFYIMNPPHQEQS